jgi:KaiC/GvpD/RAD55 family RecA-like ATPase
MEAEPKTPQAFRCDGMIALAGHWIASEASERRTLLEECWRLTKTALDSFSAAKNQLEYGETFAHLSIALYLRNWFADDYDTDLRNVADGVKYGEQAVESLSRLGGSFELARVYAQTAIYLEMFGLDVRDPAEKERFCQKALSYMREAKRLSEEAALLESYWQVGFNLGSDESMAIVAKMLDYSTKARDRFMIGWALALMSFNIAYNMDIIEDAEERGTVLIKAMDYAEKARNEFSKLSWISPPLGGYLWVEAPYTNYFRLLASDEPDINRRRALLQKAVESAPEGFEKAERSRSPGAIWNMHQSLSRALSHLANTETDLEKRRKILEESLEHRNESSRLLERTNPFIYIILGGERNSIADIKCQIADLTVDSDRRKEMLREAIQYKEDAVSLYLKDLSGYRSDDKAAYGRLSSIQFEHGEMLNKLYELTGDKNYTVNALEVFRQAAETFRKLGLMSRSAECWWRSAQAHDTLGEYSRAAESFALGAKDYQIASDKIPKLKDFYGDYTLYLQAWSEIEKGRYHHGRQEHDLAEEHFRKTAELHESSKHWSYLAPNYAAWTQMEHAEELSRRGEDTEALKTFQQLIELFDNSGKAIQAQLSKTENMDERQMSKGMLKAIELRKEYCRARIAIEEAKILNKKGEHYSSSEKYQSAIEALGKLDQSVDLEQDRKEIKHAAALSKAWLEMELAEAEESPKLYLKASQLFEEARELSPNEKSRALALGHSRFCRALEAGTRFADTGDTAMHIAANKHLQGAANHYVKAGAQDFAEYAKATELLFDGYVYMYNAKEEKDPEKQTKLCIMAQKVLEKSAESFMKAKQTAKREQVLRILERLQKERELAVSLTEVLHASIMASTTAFASPSPTSENAVGLERFEHAEVNANLILSQTELKVGETVDVEIELANPGKGQALLTGIEGAIPEGFELTAKPEFCRVKDFNIDMKGRRLDPLKVEELKLTLRPKRKGSFRLKPLISYIDENGNHRSHKPKPQLIEVTQLVLPDRTPTGYQDLDDLLFGGIPQNNAVILSSPSCDWRDFLVNGFLEAGAKQGEITFCLATSPGSAKRLVEEFSSFHLFICSPQAGTIAKDVPNVFKLNGVENLTDIIIALTSAIRNLDPSLKSPRRICIGLVSDVLLQHHAVQTRRWLNTLILELKSTDFTTLAVVDPQMHPSEELHAILDLFDGEINIYEKQTEKGPDRFLRIKRLSDQEYLGSELLLRKEDLKKRK